MNNWLSNWQAPKHIPVLICWFTWKERNKLLFDGHLLSAWAVTARVIGALSVPFPARISLIVRHKPVMIRTGYSAAFFDGAAIVGGTNCGAGGTILCSDSLVYRWFLNCGEGSNTKAE